MSPSHAAASQTPSPTPSPTSRYAADLTFTGGLTAHVTQGQAPPSGSSNDCGDGAVYLNVILNGQVWSVSATESAYHGPGQYGTGDGFGILLGSPSLDLWMTTAGTATYKDGKSLSLDVDLTNLMAGPGEPGADAHMSGSFSCA